MVNLLLSIWLVSLGGGVISGSVFVSIAVGQVEVWQWQ